MSIEEFIREVLIKEIGEIKNDHPYLAFLLICEGIEFLGKMIADDPWEQVGKSEKHFIGALKTFDALKKYYHEEEKHENKQGVIVEYNSLYRIIRCGFCHGLRPSSKGSEKYSLGKDKINLSDTIKDEGNSFYLNINQLYLYFKEACEYFLKNQKSLNKHNELNNEFLTLTPVHNLDNEKVYVSGVGFVANSNPSEINHAKSIKLNLEE